MKQPMAVVSARTGLSPHVVRAWERRYGAVRPTRTTGGHRLYTEEEIERLRLLHRLTSAGWRISQIARLPTPQLRELRRKQLDGAGVPAAGGAPSPATAAPPRLDTDRMILDCYRAIEQFDSERLAAIFRRAALCMSSAAVVDRLAGPLMRRIGTAWQDGTLKPAQEHLATATVSRTLTWLMENFEPLAEAPSAVVATPIGQRHELGALLAATTVAAEGWRVTYLGADLPAADISLAAVKTRALAVILSIVYPPANWELAEDLRKLRNNLPNQVQILAGGDALESYGEMLERIDVIRLDRFADLGPALRRLRPNGGGAPIKR